MDRLSSVALVLSGAELASRVGASIACMKASSGGLQARPCTTTREHRQKDRGTTQTLSVCLAAIGTYLLYRQDGSLDVVDPISVMSLTSALCVYGFSMYIYYVNGLQFDSELRYELGLEEQGAMPCGYRSCFLILGFASGLIHGAFAAKGDGLAIVLHFIPIWTLLGVVLGTLHSQVKLHRECYRKSSYLQHSDQDLHEKVSVLDTAPTDTTTGSGPIPLIQNHHVIDVV